ncbi:MAG TPA: DUF4192 domain-containing protein [Ornithinibacter sp.]|nr:DUF4192 domain-containing protein [Ornithinibacter sp.]
MTADITLRGPGDVVAILPYQLGYHPRDSAVVISLRGKQVGLVARTDLPPDEHVDEVVSTLMGPLVRDGATSVIVVGYEDAPDTSQPLLLALVERLERAGIHVVDVAVVREGRRYSAICSDPCCPPDGVALPDPADVPGVAEYVALGRSPLRSRGDVEGLVAPEPWRCLGVERAIDTRSRMPRARRRSVAAWRAVLDPGERGRRPPDRRAVADLALGLADIPWRDGLIAWLVPSVLSTEEIDPRVVSLLRSSMPTWGGMGAAAEHRVMGVRVGERVGERAARDALTVERDDLLHRLLALCRSVPDECPDEAAAVCTVAAHVAWVGGDGAITRAAVERALRLAPGYRLARLLNGLVENGLRLPPITRAGHATSPLDRTG